MCFEAGWDGFRVKQLPSMNSSGYLGIEDTRIVSCTGCVASKANAWYNGCTTAKNERSNQEDDHHLGVRDTSIEG